MTQLIVETQAHRRGATMTNDRFGGGDTDTDQLTAAVLAAGALRWKHLVLEPQSLCHYLRERALSREVVTPALAGDLFLACACLNGVPGALEAFQATFMPILTATAKRFDKSGALTEELRQALSESLFVGKDERGPRIADYKGRGPLSGWVRTCAKRAALRLSRTDNPERLMTSDALAEEIADTCDQELVLLKSHYGELFRQELVSALSILPAKDRMLLQLHLVAGLSTTRIAKMYHLNQSSISRQLQRAASSVFALIKQRIHSRLGVATAELESLLDLARSRIELSLSSMDGVLRDESVVPQKDE